MRISDIMTTHVETIEPDELAQTAFERMKVGHLHHLVVSVKNEVLGVVSRGDLGEGRDGAMAKHASVGALMTPNPVCVDPEMTLQRAANVMRGHSVGCLPVVEHRRLVGIVTISDMLELVGRGTQPTPAGRTDRAPHRRTSRLPSRRPSRELP